MAEANEQTETTWRNALVARWRSFWIVLCDPWNAGLLMLAAIMLYFGQSKSNDSANVIAQIVLALSTGVLGGRIANELAALVGTSVIEARARVAVRSLQLLFRTTVVIDERVGKFLSASRSGSIEPAVTQRNYEEVISLCRLLQEQANSSIDNWRDVVPEAQLSSTIGEITALRDSLDAQHAAVAQLNSSLAAAIAEARQQQDMSAEMRQQLAQKEDAFKKEIRELNDSLARTSAQLEMAKANMASSSGGLSGTRGNTVARAYLNELEAATSPRRIASLQDMLKSGILRLDTSVPPAPPPPDVVLPTRAPSPTTGLPPLGETPKE
jgi:hypothetical protein